MYSIAAKIQKIAQQKVPQCRVLLRFKPVAQYPVMAKLTKFFQFMRGVEPTFDSGFTILGT